MIYCQSVTFNVFYMGIMFSPNLTKTAIVHTRLDNCANPRIGLWSCFILGIFLVIVDLIFIINVIICKLKTLKGWKNYLSWTKLGQVHSFKFTYSMINKNRNGFEFALSQKYRQNITWHSVNIVIYWVIWRQNYLYCSTEFELKTCQIPMCQSFSLSCNERQTAVNNSGRGSTLSKASWSKLRVQKILVKDF